MAQQSALRVELVAPAAVRSGDRVPVTIRITNPTDKPVDAYFVGREIAFDLIVRKVGSPSPSATPGESPRGQPRPADTSVVWRRMAGRTIATILQVRTLGPGETIELRDTWNQRDDAGAKVPAGSYAVQGIVMGQNREELKTGIRVLEVRARP